MNLSSILFNNVSNKLNLVLLEKEKLYLKNLFAQIKQLEQDKDDILKHKRKNLLNEENFFNTQYNLFKIKLTNIYYIINITFFKNNTTIHLSDVKGKTKLFYSTGNIKLKGNQKKKRKIGINKIIALFIKKISLTNKTPVILHLTNVKSYKYLIIKRLKKKVLITAVKNFTLTPYNGCRQKKIRRKKRKKTFK